MRRSAFRAWICFGILVVGASPAWLSAQAPTSPMAMMTDIAVKPSMLGEFRAAMKAMVELSAKHKAGYGWTAHMTDDHHCLLISPVADYADAGKMLKEDASLSQYGAEFSARAEKLAATYESFTSYMVSYKPELSLLPARPRPSNDSVYTIYDIWYIIPGREQEFEALAREIAALAKAKGSVDAWICLCGELGCDQPVYFYYAVDKGPAEFWDHNAEMWKALGQEGEVLNGKMIRLLRKRDMLGSWYDAELSYQPKK